MFLEHPVWLRVDVQPGDLRAVGDPERMHQVVANLLDNAVRHSPHDGRVWLSAHAATDGVTTIEVADEGPGIPAGEAERVFERFHRVDAARAARDGGTGLGLAISRWIVDAHGGTIRVREREPARLPRRRRAPPNLKGSDPLTSARVKGSDPIMLRGVRAVYESFWADAPRDPEPWAFGERGRLLRADVRPGERVLDLGCGAGRFLTVIREAGAEAVGVELAEAAAERARANVPGADVRLVEPDGSLPLGHGEVDLVWCSEVLEHIPDAEQALHEVRRVLRTGGRLLLTVPFHGRIQAALIGLTRFDAHFDPQGQHVRFFTARSLARSLDATGFAPVEIQAARRRAAAAPDAGGARYPGLISRAVVITSLWLRSDGSR